MTSRARPWNCTVGLDKVGTEVNLEKALRLADRLGGHLVTGHVDGVGEVLKFCSARATSSSCAHPRPLPATSQRRARSRSTASA